MTPFPKVLQPAPAPLRSPFGRYPSIFAGAIGPRPGRGRRSSPFEGKLRYRILEPGIREFELSPERPGVVKPRVPHEAEAVPVSQSDS